MRRPARAGERLPHRLPAGNTLAGTTTGLEPLRQALRGLGYVEGGNLDLEIRAAEGHTERVPALAAELVALKLDLILFRGSPQGVALKEATRTIPIVGIGVRDPVELGLAASLARPGGNITGTATAGAVTEQRRLQLLKEAIPGAVRVAWLSEGPANPSGVQAYEAGLAAAPALGITLQQVVARAPDELADALAAAARDHPDAMNIPVGSFTVAVRPAILEFLAANRLPAITSTTRQFVDGGALMYYDADEVERDRRAASIVDRILKGASPADIPFEAPTKYELIINMRTAKAIGLTIPPSVLAQATELIQ